MKSSPALGEDGFASVGGKASKTENSWQGGMRAGIGSVDEVNVNEDGSLKYIRRLNGDQDHQEGMYVFLSENSVFYTSNCTSINNVTTWCTFVGYIRIEEWSHYLPSTNRLSGPILNNRSMILKLGRNPVWARKPDSKVAE